MNYVIKCLALAWVLTFGLLYFLMAIIALVNGRVKTEPSEPWIYYRERPIRFVFTVAIFLVFAAFNAFGVVIVVSKILD
jgi:hypothetical protein